MRTKARANQSSASFLTQFTVTDPANHHTSYRHATDAVNVDILSITVRGSSADVVFEELEFGESSSRKQFLMRNRGNLPVFEGWNRLDALE